MGKKKITAEALTSALFEKGTVRGAADALHVSERTVYGRMKDEDFRTVYEQRRDELLRDAVQRLSGRIGEAVDVLAEIMNGWNPAAVRVSAARTVLEYADRLSDRMIQRGQQAAQRQADEGRLSELIDGLRDDPLTAALKAEAARLEAAHRDADGE